MFWHWVVELAASSWLDRKDEVVGIHSIKQNILLNSSINGLSKWSNVRTQTQTRLHYFGANNAGKIYVRLYYAVTVFNLFKSTYINQNYFEEQRNFNKKSIRVCSFKNWDVSFTSVTKKKCVCVYTTPRSAPFSFDHFYKAWSCCYGKSDVLEQIPSGAL